MLLRNVNECTILSDFTISLHFIATLTHKHLKENNRRQIYFEGLSFLFYATIRLLKQLLPIIQITDNFGRYGKTVELMSANN